MKSIRFSIVTMILFLACNIVFAQSRSYPPVIETATHVETFKVVDDFELKLWIFEPRRHQATDSAPAIVFFFGGGWTNGSPSQLTKQCEYLAARGMVAITADYRVASRNNVTMDKCVSDAKSAIRWVREHSSEYGIDPNRIVASGGSAGGHLAVSTALLPKFDEPNENLEISSKPNALVLFNPALYFDPQDNGEESDAENRSPNPVDRYGDFTAEDLSPYHHITKGAPPTIVLSGSEDFLITEKTINMFGNKMKEVGSKCTFVIYEGEPHGFFNWGMKNNGPYIATTKRVDEFLVSIGYLEAPPKSTEFKFE